ncbi:MAG: AAA family ATPase [Candidatus Gracilibacteria bacterium]|nr:AAA family ATPase [Candidatus Gracilibacteria bacterium]MDD2908176.1 AAA family ATPase [Candidatus Gracilibacteria bacterium]
MTQTKQHPKDIEINEIFEKTFKLIESGKNIFITGKAGTGKSTLLEYFRDHTDKKVVVLAPTGVSAINIRGQTVHSFFGFKPDITYDNVRKTKKDDDTTNIYKKLDIIIIDEISMVRADLLDCADKFLRLNGKFPNHPFGGIQMIFIGDLYQLSPVVNKHENDLFTSHYESPYFFSAKLFDEFDMEFIELEKIYRQTDNSFTSLLNKIRNNTADYSDIKALNERYSPTYNKHYNDFCIHLTTTNKDADVINETELDKLPDSYSTFYGRIEGEFGKESTPTAIELKLKIGSQIMMLNNDPGSRWVNGSIGKIVGIDHFFDEDIIIAELSDGKEVEITQHTWEIFKFFLNEDGNIESQVLGKFTQFPIRLAFAVTIHKSQGKTFDRVVVDLGRGSFAHGQVYVALSRCTTFEGLTLARPLRKSDIRMDDRVQEFLCKYQHKLASRDNVIAERLYTINKAIKENRNLQVTFLKSTNEKSKRTLKPEYIGEMECEGTNFLGLEGFCHLKQENRVFKVDNMVDVEVVEE